LRFVRATNREHPSRFTDMRVQSQSLVQDDVGSRNRPLHANAQLHRARLVDHSPEADDQGAQKRLRLPSCPSLLSIMEGTQQVLPIRAPELATDWIRQVGCQWVAAGFSMLSDYLK
jgi:hypothetical protein